MDTRTALNFAYDLARQSPDPNTQIGAVILNPGMNTVVGQGRNDFPRHVHILPERLKSPEKYSFIEHAERNAIYDAAWSGKKTLGTTMVCTLPACADCGRAIIQSGIAKVIGHKKTFEMIPERWQSSISTSLQMMMEADVEVVLWDGVVGCKPVLLDGQFIFP